MQYLSNSQFYLVPQFILNALLLQDSNGYLEFFIYYSLHFFIILPHRYISLYWLSIVAKQITPKLSSLKLQIYIILYSFWESEIQWLITVVLALGRRWGCSKAFGYNRLEGWLGQGDLHMTVRRFQFLTTNGSFCRAAHNSAAVYPQKE